MVRERKLRGEKTRAEFQELQTKYMPPPKRIIQDMLSRSYEGNIGIPWKELYGLYKKRMPLKWRILELLQLGLSDMRIWEGFELAIEELKKEGRITEKEKLFYPK